MVLQSIIKKRALNKVLKKLSNKVIHLILHSGHASPLKTILQRFLHFRVSKLGQKPYFLYFNHV